MKILKIILLILITFTLSGCFDYENISQNVYVDSIGLDYSDNKYQVYLHLSNPNTLTTTEQGSATIEDKYSIAKGEGDSIFQGLDLIVRSSNYEIMLTQLKSIVVSKEFYTYDRMKEFYDFFKEHPNFYPTPNLFLCDGKIGDLFQVNNPENISPYYSFIGMQIYDLPSRYSDYINFTSAMLEKNMTPYIIIIKSSKDIWKNGDKDIVTIEITGKAYINKETKEVVYAEYEENRGVMWPANFAGNLFEMDKEHIFEFTQYSYQLKYKKNKVIVVIKIHAKRASVMKEKNEELSSLIKKTIQNDINKSFNNLKEQNIDFLNINDLLYRHGQLSDYNNYQNIKLYYEMDVMIVT